MTTKPRFRWTFGYMGTVGFNVTDATGTYEAELRTQLSDYESSICNGDLVRQECRSAIGILRRANCQKVGTLWSYAMPTDTVAAFNAWRAAEHAERIAEIKRQPERYGVLADDDPILQPPMVARAGDYVFGQNIWRAI